MAKKKSCSENLRGEKYKFNVDDFIVATTWNYQSPNRGFYDDDLLRIIDFFCLHSPCRQGSFSPCTLDSLGWRNPWNSSKFRAQFMTILGLNEDTFAYCEYQHHFKNKWESFCGNVDFLSTCSPYAVIAKAGETNQYMDLLHRLRNSFAHGRYAVKKDYGEYYLFFEDVKERNGHCCVLARICVTKSALKDLLAFLRMEGTAAAGLESIIETR